MILWGSIKRLFLGSVEKYAKENIFFLSLRRIKEGVSETTVVFKSVVFIFSFLPVPSLWIWLPT